MRKKIIPPKNYAKVLAELSDEDIDEDNNTDVEDSSDGEWFSETPCEERNPEEIISAAFVRLCSDQASSSKNTPLQISVLDLDSQPSTSVHVQTTETIRLPQDSTPYTETEKTDPNIDFEGQKNEPSAIDIPKNVPQKGRATKCTKRKCTAESTDSEKKPSKIIFHDLDEVLGKNNFKWLSKISSLEGKILAKNTIPIRPEPTAKTNYSCDPLECFCLFFSDSIVEKIIFHTNEKVTATRLKYKNDASSNLKDISKDEFLAYLGILVLSAAQKDNHLSATALFDSKISGNNYKATMSKTRFDFLTACVSFDDKLTRPSRILQTKLAAISEIWEDFLQNCRKNYRPSSYLTIGEQLVGFKGRCPFKMYIPSKPNKCGIKIIMVCDSATYYMIDAETYTGKGSIPPNVPAAEYFVEKLTRSVHGSGRNITMDNWFSSVPLAKKMKEKNLTVLGTLGKKKGELPSEFTDPCYKSRETGSSFFLYNEDVTVLSYKTKKNGVVTLMSSMHSEGIVSETTGKPDMIAAYNAMKGGVDACDQLCQNMNCSRKTRRWPMCFFYNMMNLALINAYVVYVANFMKVNGSSRKPLSRYSFAIQLHYELTREWQKRRLQAPNLPYQLKVSIEEALGIDSNENKNVPTQGQKRPRKACRFCSYKKKRNTSYFCGQCDQAVCLEHTTPLCPNCKDL